MFKMVDGTGIIGVDMICPLGISTPQPPNYDRVELEGAGMLVLPNSLDAPLERLELGGKTEQVTTTGKNLANPSEFVIGTIAGDTGNIIGLKQYIATGYIPVIPGKRYSTSCGNKFLAHTIFAYDKEKAKINYPMNMSSEMPEGAAYIRLSYKKIDMANVTESDMEELKKVCMVNEGSTVLPYEPYTGGKPSPSQEYPQEIKNVGKWNEETQKYEVDVKITGKNLFDIEKAKEKSNWTTSANGAGFVEIAVYVGTGSTVTVSNNTKINGPLSYYYGVALKSSEDFKYFICYPGYPNSKDTFTFTATEDYIYVRCNKTSLNDVIGVCGGLQIEIGASRTDFESYKEQTLTITSDRPLTKWDRLVEQGGEIGWLYQSASDTDVKPSRLDLFPYGFSFFKDFGNGVYVYKVVNIKKAIGFQTSLCEQFKNKDGSYSTGDLFCYSDQPSIQTQYFVTDIPTLEEFKTWMETNPLTMVYQTVESQFVPLQQSEQNAIRALKTYYPTTVITVDGGEVDPDIKVTYRKEI